MPNEITPRTGKTRWKVYALLVTCFVLGIFVLVVVGRLRPFQELPAFYAALWDVGYDLGIAFCVSAVVGGLFEFYRAAYLQMESMRDVLVLAMNDKITPEVWMDVEALIEKKNVIRRNVFLRLEMEDCQGLQKHERVLRVDHDYDLYPLHDKRETFKVGHDLDYQFARPSLNLPRWEKAVARHVDPSRDGGKSADVQACDFTPKNKMERRVQYEVNLPSRRTDEFEQVSTSRYELITLPGAYNFYVPEFVKGIKITLVGHPDWIEPEVVVRPYGGGDPLENDRDFWFCPKLLFPGQGVEIKFKERALNAPSGNPAQTQADLSGGNREKESDAFATVAK